MHPTIFLFQDDIFCRNFRHLKEKNHLSRRALAHLLNISPFQVKRIELLQLDRLDMRLLLRISHIYDVDINDLITKDLTQ